MTQMHQRDASNIYDLGYRRYEAERLGRRHAVAALYVESLRGAFGLGRSTAAKIAPMVLIGFALVPVVVAIIISTLGVGDTLPAAEYYSVIKYVLALYCAVVAPDIAGRDQRNRSLTLYFSRAISRTDYALSKVAAMTTAMLLVTLVPQLLLLAGKALTAPELSTFAAEEWDQVFPIAGSALLGSALIASISVLIAAHTPQRAFATAGIMVAFILPVVVVASMVMEIEAPGTRYAVFASPFDLVDGFTAWMFGMETESVGESVEAAGFRLWPYAPVALVATLATTAGVVRRYRTVQA